MSQLNSTALQTTSVGEVPEDYAAFEAFVQGGKTAAAEPDAENDNNPEGEPAEGEPEAAGASDTPDDTEHSGEGDGDEPNAKPGTPSEPEPKKKGGWQRKIEKLEHENQTLAERLAAVESGTPAGKSAGAQPEPAKPAVDAEPQPGDFEDYAQYIKALSSWTVRQEQVSAARTRQEQESRQQFETALNAWKDRETAVKAKHADYDEVVDSINDVAFAPQVQFALMESEHGPEIAYLVSKDRAEAERIAKLSPARQLVELGKIEARLSAPRKETPKPSNAPEPIAPVGGAGASRVTKRMDDPDVDFATFERQANKRFGRG